MAEIVDVVDDNDVVVGKSTDEEMYRNKLTHRIVHVLVINPKTKEMFIQVRASTKSYLPGYYCTSAGGHVRSGESYEQAAKRELKEELGIEKPLENVGNLEFVANSHKRLIRVFMAYSDDKINFADGEVAGGSFMSARKIDELIGKGEKIHPQLPVCFELLKNGKAFR